jgi:hypothetical protein
MGWDLKCFVSFLQVEGLPRISATRVYLREKKLDLESVGFV